MTEYSKNTRTRKFGHQYFADEVLTRVRVNCSLSISPVNVAALVGRCVFVMLLVVCNRIDVLSDFLSI